MSDPNAPQGPQFQGPQQPGQPPQGWQSHQGPQQPPTKQEARAHALAEKAHRKAMRPWFKKKRFIVPLALVALVLLGRLFGGNTEAPTAAVPAEPSTSQAAESTKAPSEPKATEEEKTKESVEPANASIGDTVTAGDWDFKVTKFRCGINSVGDQYLGKKAQGQFCFLNVNATNNGNDEGTLTEGSQRLLDADGKEYSSDSEASLYEDSDSVLFLEGVNPGNTAKGLIVFDIPKKAKPTQASLAGGFFGTKSALVDID